MQVKNFGAVEELPGLSFVNTWLVVEPEEHPAHQGHKVRFAFAFAFAFALRAVFSGVSVSKLCLSFSVSLLWQPNNL